ncbi:MAG: MATE family efflux transporter [Lachnospiraceae bacterium]|nr:MATE family efflux transporter [Lachnospiraceae bacterium]MDD7176873.1 MATE family efflux transporter [bacterium]MDY5517594.1 MATE family efflux transporter [Lachnospiraceae bacterium]
MRDLTTGKPMKQIILFMLPILIGNILQLTYSLVDTRVVGSVLGDTALAAVGATTSLSSMVIGFLQGLTNGFAVIIARFFGANDEKGLKRSVAASVTLALGVSLALTAVTIVCLKQILGVLHVGADIYEMSYSYIVIIFAGMTVAMLYNLCAAMLRAIGDSVTPLIFLGISVVLNIFGDLFCICVLDLGVRGAAVATVAAQLFATVLCLIFIYKKYELLHIGKADFAFSRKLVEELFGCGLSMGFMGCLVNIGSVALQTGINTLGNDIIVAHTAARKITELFMLLFGVVGTTMATYSGQNFGAGRFDRVKEGVRAALTIVFIWCGIVLVCSYTVAPVLIRLVTGTSSPAVISAATSYLKFDTLLYWVTAIIIVLRNTMQGIGDHITPVISSSIECVGKIILVNLLVEPFGYWGIIVSEPITWCFMVIPLIVQYLRNPMLKTKKEHTV